jgi:hypothetical protein
MIDMTPYRVGQLLAAVAAAVLLTACVDEATLGPDPGAPAAKQFATAQVAEGIGAGGTAAAAAAGTRTADLGACPNLRAPEGSRLVLHVYASGVQIYRWNGTSWSFVAPEALLFADAQERGIVGTHYAGPTWASRSGSKVVGAVLERCTPDPAAIPWLLLGTVSTEGPGIFQRVAYIQRVNTVGGNAPADPGNVMNEEARIPYTTEYLFYRTQ